MYNIVKCRYFGFLSVQLLYFKLMKSAKKPFVLTCVLCSLLLSPGLSSHPTIGDDDKKQLKHADDFFKKKNYLAALPLYLTYERSSPDDYDAKFKIGICYIYKSDAKLMSVKYLEDVLKNIPKTKGLHYFLGRAYHLNYRFDKALEYFRLAVEDKRNTDDRKEEIEMYISKCKEGKEMIENPIDVIIQNMGPPINSDGSEYVPVISADESVLIFTYKGVKSTGGLRDEYGRPDLKGKYYEDIYLSNKIGEIWLEPEKNKLFYATVFSNRVQEAINSTGHDASIALSSDGQKLLIYKDTDMGSGDIYVSEKDGYAWTYPIKLNININSEHWEGSASLSSNENILYFSSERPGGLGGKDIYRSVMRDDGVWDEAENLGAMINTPYDDDGPFIHPDGKYLYFSSKGHKGMGGYDIFLSALQEDGSWSAPENMGYPINTTADDIYFVVTGNGKRGYYSSGRLGGYGQQDLYIVHLGTRAKKHGLLLVKGQVTADDEFTDGKITCTYGDDNKGYGVYGANAATGQYLVNLPGGRSYQLKFEVAGFSEKAIDISTIGLDTFMEKIIDVSLYSPDFKPQLVFDGNVFYSEDPLNPARGIKITISNPEETTTRETLTDQLGYYRFVNLPMDQQYALMVDESDPGFINGPVINGRVTIGGKPKPGLTINKLFTNVDGGFKIASKGKSQIYVNLPANIPPLDTLRLSDPGLYQEVMKRFGDRSATDLVFKIQIAAYAVPENFDYSMIADLAKVETQLLDDGITRFTMGGFETLKEAEDFKQKIVQRDVVDAFTLIFYRGERKYISEVIADDFYVE